MLILFYLLTYIFLIHSKIIIQNANVAPISRRDIGMIFYVTLMNPEKCDYVISTKSLGCCEILGREEKECNKISIIGGYMGILHRSSTKNISLIYPNLYVHHRVGKCLIAVMYTKKPNGTERMITKHVTYNTTISKISIPPVLKGYYDLSDVSTCKTVDLDPLNQCEPVDCTMKYAGYRNFFYDNFKKCSRVPLCIANPAEPLPDVAYVPTSNRCRDLAEPLSKHDLLYLEKGISEGSCLMSIEMFSDVIRCHHGHINNDTGICECNPGWISSEEYEELLIQPNLALIHMCNIEVSTWNSYNKTKIRMTVLLVAITGVCFAMAVVILSFLLHIFYRFIKSLEIQTDDDILTKASSCNCSSKKTKRSFRNKLNVSCIRNYIKQHHCPHNCNTSFASEKSILKNSNTPHTSPTNSYTANTSRTSPHTSAANSVTEKSHTPTISLKTSHSPKSSPRSTSYISTTQSQKSASNSEKLSGRHSR